MAGKGGGAWKVAYADFVTAMMAFFMVMWLLSQNDDVKFAVAEHFRNPYGQFAVGDSLMPPRNPQFFRDRRPTAATGENPRPPSEADDQATRKPFTLTLQKGDRTILGTAVFFGESSAELDEAAQSELKGFVPLVQGKPQKIEIRGHSVRKPPAVGEEQKDPWQLSYARCLITMQYLQQQGIAPERLRLSQAAANEPYTIGDNPELVARNSRVEVFLLNEVAEDGRGTPAERDLRFKKK